MPATVSWIRRSRFLAAAGLACLLLFSVSGFAAVSPLQDASLTLYRDAVNLVLQGRYQEAAASFESLLSNFPGSAKAADASDKLAYCLEKLGNQREAFVRYRETSEKWAGSFIGRRSAQNAVRLARSLRQVDGDLYDQYLRGLLEGQGVGSEAAARLTAMSMAEIGNWNGLDRLLEGLHVGSNLEQIRISELLRMRALDPRVRAAFMQALTTSRNPIVRLNAIAALSQSVTDDTVRASLVQAMRRDADPGLRSMVVRSLGKVLDREDVRTAFRAALEQEPEAIVLMQLTNVLSARSSAGAFQPVILARLRSEQDPMAKVILSGMLKGEGMKSEEGIFVVKSLADNPEPGVRISALRLLQPHSGDPQIRVLFLDKLENDPNDAVRTVALNALSGQLADDEVRRIVMETVRTSRDVGLVATSVKALGSQVQVPEVRQNLMEKLRLVDEPVIAWQVTIALAPALSDPDVGAIVLDRLRKPAPLELKSAISTAMENARLKVLPEGFEQMFLQEPNDLLAGSYLRIIQQVKPQAVAELAKKRPVRGFSFQMHIETSPKKQR